MSTPTPLETLIASGTKLWLDSIDPDLVKSSFALGATGATSNPAIIEGLLRTGRFDEGIKLAEDDLDASAIAWQMTDELVQKAQEVFHQIWEKTQGNDGYVSFELDPLIEDPAADMPHADRVERYVELGRKWSAGNDNRMIKVPATPAGIESLETLCADGVTLNVTLIFTDRQYQAARDAIWSGAQKRKSLDAFKSVYSVFVSRVDAYTVSAVPSLSKTTQGEVGTVNAKRIWRTNRDFWAEFTTPLKQEIIFASTGTKNPEDDPWKYVAAFAGSDIQTNPPGTNDAAQKSGLEFKPMIEEMPSQAVLDEIDKLVDFAKLESELMDQGLKKFAAPQQSLLKLISEKRAQPAV